VSMLNYLASSSCPDIAFVAHQCAHFCANPKWSHELVLHCIVCYQKGSTDKGYVLHPDPKHLNLNCYVDADFAGLWSPTTSSDPISIKSRTGYLITFANCPILWSSKVKSEIAPLSQAAHDIIPMRSLLTEFSDFLG